MNRTLIKNLHNHVGQEVTISGWVDNRRDHGKLIFIDVRDAAGKVQTVVTPAATEETRGQADAFRTEWVVEITGTVNSRPEKMVNPEEPNGDIELEIQSVRTINEAQTLPFDVTTDGREIGEELRLAYRYLDLRRPRMQENIKKRAQVMRFLRMELAAQGFIEIETPVLTKSTPEGARDYVVPSRLHRGMFYALPQSPQQYKQLLMDAGFERYYQFARCFRDEDTRGDRQPEFTQLDIEMSFVDREQLMQLIEGMFTRLVEELYPHKKVLEKPWPSISYREAMEKYGTDRPDIRENTDDPDELAFVWVVDFPLFEPEKEGGHFAPSHHMFTAPVAEDIPKLDADPHAVRSHQVDLVLNGYEIGGGSIRIHDPELQAKIFELIGFSDEQKAYFKHMLDAFTYGIPPHGGIAPGFDRLMMLLQGEETIREVIAFPKTGEGRDLMMGTPAGISEEQRTELGLKIIPVKKENKKPNAMDSESDE